MSRSKRSPYIPPYSRFCYPLAIAFFCLFLSSSTARAADSGPAWLYDLEAAKKTAKLAGKDLVVVFTGRGWCQPCELLNQKVFQDKGFVKATAEKFLFVELDFNSNDSDEEKQREKKLQDQYLVKGFPSTVLMGPAGVPFASLNGYFKDLGPEKTAGMFAAARKHKHLRDDFFEKANSASDEQDRVKHLHDGLAAVAVYLDYLGAHSDDSLFVFYKTQIGDILRSSHESGAGVRTIYAARSQAREARLASQSSAKSLNEKLLAFTTVDDYRGAIKHVDSILANTSVTGADDFWLLQVRRLGYFEADGAFEEAIKNSHRLLANESLPEWGRGRILDAEARCLASSERLPEAVALYDLRIAAVKDDPKNTLRLLASKARFIENRGTNQDVIEAWKDVQKLAKPQSSQWMGATVWIARALQKSEEYEEAASLFGQILETYEAAKRGEVELTFPWTVDGGTFIMFEAAQCHFAAGNLQDAKKFIDQATNGIERLRKSPRKDDNRHAKLWQEMFDALIEKVRKKSAAK